MNLPIQAQPVMRNVSTAAFTGRMQASQLCSLACIGCERLPGFLCRACAAAAGGSCNC